MVGAPSDDLSWEGLDIRMDRRQISQASGTAVLGLGGAAALGGLINNVAWLLWVGIALLGISILVLLYLFVTARTPIEMKDKDREAAVPPTQPQASVISHNQMGGVTAHTVNVGNPDRDLFSQESATFRQELLKIPKDRSWIIETQFGDGEAQRLAKQIGDYLLSNGIDVRGMMQSQIHPPVEGVRLQLSGPPPHQGSGLITVGYKPRS